MTLMDSDPVYKMLLAIDSSNPSEQDVITYLQALYARAIAQGVPNQIPPERFYVSGDIELWKWTFGEDYPKKVKVDAEYDFLPIHTLLDNALTPFFCPVTDMVVSTFKDRVRRAILLLKVWSQQNEKPDDKRARKNREAQKRLRARSKNDGSPECLHAQAIKVAWDDFIAACNQRKAAMEQWAAFVESKRQVWVQLKKTGPAGGQS